jgi:putative transposase
VAEGSIGHADGIATGGLSASQGRRRTPRTTDSRHQLPIAPNLLARNFAAEKPDQVWLADIS